MVGALTLYPNANRDVQAKALALARALPVVAASDAPTRAMFKHLGAVYLDSIGTTDRDFLAKPGNQVLLFYDDPLNLCLPDAFAFTCDGMGSMPRILDELSHAPDHVATVTVRDTKKVAALRALLKKATGK